MATPLVKILLSTITREINFYLTPTFNKYPLFPQLSGPNNKITLFIENKLVYKIYISYYFLENSSVISSPKIHVGLESRDNLNIRNYYNLNYRKHRPIKIQLLLLFHRSTCIITRCVYQTALNKCKNCVK